MIAALEGGEWSAARPGRTLPPGKTRYPLYGRLGGPQGRSGGAENNMLLWNVNKQIRTNNNNNNWYETKVLFNCTYV